MPGQIGHAPGLASTAHAPSRVRTAPALPTGSAAAVTQAHTLLSLRPPSAQSHAWNNPHHPFTIAANVLWAVLFGWQLALMHLAAGLVQALTIVGFGTALTSLQLAAFAM